MSHRIVLTSISVSASDPPNGVVLSDLRISVDRTHEAFSCALHTSHPDFVVVKIFNSLMGEKCVNRFNC